jgi:hypothetical protein
MVLFKRLIYQLSCKYKFSVLSARAGVPAYSVGQAVNNLPTGRQARPTPQLALTTNKGQNNLKF